MVKKLEPPLQIYELGDPEQSVLIDRSMINVPVSIRASGPQTYSLIIQSPVPPLGVDRARVTVRTRDGAFNFVHVYEKVCLIPSPPNDFGDGENDDEDVADAYEDCVDLANDLFCEPTDFVNTGNLESNVRINPLAEPIGGKLTAGTLVDVDIIMKGSGYYTLSIDALLTNGLTTEIHYESNGIETLGINYVIQKQILIRQDYRLIKFKFQTLDTERERPSTYTEQYEVYIDTRDPPRPDDPVLRQLSSDTNLSDENTEFYVMSGAVADINYNKLNIDPATITSQMVFPDPFRRDQKLFWIKKSPEEDVLELFTSGMAANQPPRLGSATPPPLFDDSYTLTREQNSARHYYANQCSNELFINKSTDNGLIDVVYINEKPYTPKELSNNNVSADFMLLDVKKEYNYYYREYENYLSTRKEDSIEHLIPNMYNILLVDKVRKTRKQQNPYEAIQIDPDIINLTLLSSDDYAEKYRDLDIQITHLFAKKGQTVQGYGINNTGWGIWPFEKTHGYETALNRIQEIETEIYGRLINIDWYESWLKEASDQKIDSLIGENKPFLEKAKNILIPYSGIDTIDDLSKQNQLFPLFVDINFDTDKKANSFSLELYQRQHGERMLIDWINRFLEEDGVQNLELVKQQGMGSTAKIFKSNNRYIDITYIGERMRPLADNFVFLGNYNNYLKIPEDELTPVMQRELTQIINNISETIMPFYSRTYEQITKGKKCYKETLFYRIEKREKRSNKILQNIWIARDPSKDSIRYIDTQVIYDKEYVYTIYSYDVTIGNQYDYSVGVDLLQFPGIESGTIERLVNFYEDEDYQLILNALIDEYRGEPGFSDFVNALIRARSSRNNGVLRNNIKLFLIENVYDQFEAKVTDKPPVHPQVQIKPYIGVDNRITFLFNKASATVKQEEIIIKEEDRLVFDVARRAQNLNDDELIEFSGDDLVKKYQIFRTTTPPKNYRSFADADMKEQSTSLDETNPNLRANASSFDDKIKPNTKYYYTFRCVDIHDQISNPTIVYQVEIVNENGTIFPIIEEYKFPEREDYQETKNIRRFLMLKTDVLQEYLSVSNEGVANIDTFENRKGDIITLGIKEKKPYGKLYKMRLVSKNTKKVYDINFKFVEKTIEKIE